MAVRTKPAPKMDEPKRYIVEHAHEASSIFTEGPGYYVQDGLNPQNVLFCVSRDQAHEIADEMNSGRRKKLSRAPLRKRPKPKPSAAAQPFPEWIPEKSTPARPEPKQEEAPKPTPPPPPQPGPRPRKPLTPAPSIEITTDHPQSSYGVPVCLLNGHPANHSDGIKACMRALGWRIADAAKATGKTARAVQGYRSGETPVPAEVWNVLRDALAQPVSV